MTHKILHNYLAIGTIILYLIISTLLAAFTEPETVETVKYVYETETQYKTATVYIPVAEPVFYTLTDEEREQIKRVIAAEVRFGTLEDMLGIAQVILDKATNKNRNAYGGPTILGVLSKGHADPWQGDLDDFPLIEVAVHLVFDEGFRLFDEVTTIYFTPECSDPQQVALLRQYIYVGSTKYFEFRSATLITDK